jgi:ECF sigma factor
VREAVLADATAPRAGPETVWRRIDQGGPQAAAELLPLVYGELRKLAAATMASESPGQILDATARVREGYLRVPGGKPSSQVVISSGRGRGDAADPDRSGPAQAAGEARRRS